jgi:hypothetical protein
MTRFMLMIPDLALIIICMYTDQGIHNSRLTTKGCKCYNELPAYIKQIKDNPLLKRKLKQLLNEDFV